MGKENKWGTLSSYYWAIVRDEFPFLEALDRTRKVLSTIKDMTFTQKKVEQRACRAWFELVFNNFGYEPKGNQIPPLTREARLYRFSLSETIERTPAHIDDIKILIERGSGDMKVLAIALYLKDHYDFSLTKILWPCNKCRKLAQEGYIDLVRDLIISENDPENMHFRLLIPLGSVNYCLEHPPS